MIQNGSWEINLSVSKRKLKQALWSFKNKERMQRTEDGQLLKQQCPEGALRSRKDVFCYNKRNRRKKSKDCCVSTVPTVLNTALEVVSSNNENCPENVRFNNGIFYQQLNGLSWKWLTIKSDNRISCSTLQQWSREFPKPLWIEYLPCLNTSFLFMYLFT